MVEFQTLEIPEFPKLTHNITWFARALRKAGLPIGSGRVIAAIEAVRVAGFSKREDFFWTLHACFVSRPEHREVFAQIFRLYWRDPKFLEHMMAMLMPAVGGVQEERAANAGAKRAAEALLDGVQREIPDVPEQEGSEIEIDSSLTTSTEERLRTLDFEQMSTEEVAAAKRMLARLKLPVQPILSRRSKMDAMGRHADWRRTMRQAMRQGGDLQKLARKSPRIRWPNLIILCDISGSMSHYSRMVLHFLHAVANQKGAGWAKVYGFTFGTQLTNISRHLATRDVDAALAAAGSEAQDWEGGTRIGDCLHAFNRDWSRRVMGQGAVVLLITDGLDRGEPSQLGQAMRRLHLSSRRLIWLNPLLRWDGFLPKAQGIRTMLPEVDSFRAGHSIATLEQLAKEISRPDDVGEKHRLMAALGE
ncbi:vWA domain-containing protein [Pseudopelagicola sp. nBUS_20]|uniref:vWA domain-containing protein n=1 Tax=Pseudopelagicola sp. nBUS_20 TaxID=3395317 RepID=UPI003EBBB1AC